MLYISFFFAVVIICCWQRTVNICATRYEHLFWLQVTINMAIFRTPLESCRQTGPCQCRNWNLNFICTHFVLLICLLPSLPRKTCAYIVYCENVHLKSGIVAKGAWAENIAHFVCTLRSHIQEKQRKFFYSDAEIFEWMHKWAAECTANCSRSRLSVQEQDSLLNHNYKDSKQQRRPVIWLFWAFSISICMWNSKVVWQGNKSKCVFYIP